MPPRYVYWTILIDGAATAFRAKERDELLPTFNQLKRKNSDVALRYFAQGKLWDSPEQAEWARRNKGERQDRRTAAWRPGGTHTDPRSRVRAGQDRGSNKPTRGEHRERDQHERAAAPPERRPPHMEQPSHARGDEGRHQKERPEWRNREGSRESKPREGYRQPPPAGAPPKRDSQKQGFRDRKSDARGVVGGPRKDRPFTDRDVRGGGSTQRDGRGSKPYGSHPRSNDRREPKPWASRPPDARVREASSPTPHREGTRDRRPSPPARQREDGFSPSDRPPRENRDSTRQSWGRDGGSGAPGRRGSGPGRESERRPKDSSFKGGDWGGRAWSSEERDRRPSDAQKGGADRGDRWRDRTPRENASPARATNDRFADRGGFGRKPPKWQSDRQGQDTRPPRGGQPSDERSFDKRPFEKRSFDKRSFDQRSQNRRPFDSRPSGEREDRGRFNPPAGERGASWRDKGSTQSGERRPPAEQDSGKRGDRWPKAEHRSSGHTAKGPKRDWREGRDAPQGRSGADRSQRGARGSDHRPPQHEAPPRGGNGAERAGTGKDHKPPGESSEE